MEYIRITKTLKLLKEEHGADYVEELGYRIKTGVVFPEIILSVLYPNDGKEEFSCHSFEQAISCMKSVPEQRKNCIKFYFDKYAVHRGVLKKQRWYLTDVVRYESEPKIQALF